METKANKYNKPLLVLSIISLFILLFSFSFFGIVTNLFLCFYLFFDIKEKDDEKKDFFQLLFLIVILCFICYRFYEKWHDSALIESLFSLFGISSDIVVLVIGIILCFFSSFSLHQGLKKAINKLEKYWKEEIYTNGEKDKKDLFAMIVCIVSAFGAIALCSKSSFIYPFNDWNDANCFFTVGKSMMNGVVPYRDLLEQKGPLLYLLHGFSWLISHNTFLGVYFLESICASFFLYYSYKTISLYCGKKTVFLIPILSAICYSSLPFKDGDSAEELSLPFLAVSIYIIMKSLKEKDGRFSRKDAIIIGIMSGCVFWIKFSLIGMYFGWFLAYVIFSIQNRQYKEIGETVVYIALGVFISTLPFIVYFGINRSLLDWYEVYIYDNLFLYSEENSSVISNLWFGLMQVIEKNTTVYNLCLAGFLFCFCNKNKKSFICIVLMFLFEFVLIFAGGRHYRYYSMVLDAFSSIGLICMFILFVKDLSVRSIEILNNKVSVGVLTVICLLLSFYYTPNRYLFNVKKEELPQYHFAEIMNQKENPTLLNYMFLDGGFYTAAGIIPNCKAFCKLNINLQEMYDLQEKYLKEGLCDFVVSKHEVESDKYVLLEKETFPYNETTQTFYLYGLK